MDKVKKLVTVFEDAAPMTNPASSCTRKLATASNNESGNPVQISGFDLALYRDTVPVVVNKITAIVFKNDFQVNQNPPYLRLLSVKKLVFFRK